MYWTNFDLHFLLVGLSFPLSVIVVIYIGWAMEVYKERKRKHKKKCKIGI